FTDADLRAFSDIENQLAGFSQAITVHLHARKGMVLLAVKIFDRLLRQRQPELVYRLADLQVDQGTERPRIKIRAVAAEHYIADLPLLGHEENDDDTGAGRLDFRFDVREFLQTVNPLVVLFDSGSIERLAFPGADQIADNGCGDGGIAENADFLDT